MRLIVGIVLAALALATVPAQAGTADSPNRNAQIIRQVFGRYGSQAVAVASCESHLHVWAQNGQYLGLFQMGYSERKTYGHGNNAWAQSRAANRYFIASGRDWSPWSCKPW